MIEKIKNKGLKNVYLRVNEKNGTASQIKTNTNAWIHHEDPNVDISILPILFGDSADHLLYPESEFLTSELIKKYEIDVGDEVIITGLFTHHHGNNKNLPIIRIGNIAAMEGEKIQVEGFLMDAYLIESRSIGGLSGSPVFTHLGIIRKMNGQIQHHIGEEYHHLLGLICGHYDSKTSKNDIFSEDIGENIRVNTGIAIVTPISKLVEMFDQPLVKGIEAVLSKRNDS